MIARARAEQQEVKMSEQVRDFYAKEIDFDNGPVKCVLKSDYDALHAEAEALDALCQIRFDEIAQLKAEAEALRAENERLSANIARLTSNPADHRYWEGRYRDAEAELEAARGLLAQLRGMINCTVENDTDKMPVWISTKHPVIEQIDAFLTATPALEVQDHIERNLTMAEQGERQEAVAWSLRLPDGRTTLEKAYPKWAEGEGDGYAIQPLYTSPPPAQDVSGLVEALEEIVKQYPNPDISHVAYRVHASRHAEQALAAYRNPATVKRCPTCTGTCAEICKEARP